MAGKGVSSSAAGGWHIEARYTDRSGGVTGYNISADDHHVCDAMSASMRDAHLIAAAPALLEALEALVYVVEMEHAKTCAGRVCDCDLEDTRDHRVRAARAALSAAKAWSSPTPKEAEA